MAHNELQYVGRENKKKVEEIFEDGTKIQTPKTPSKQIHSL